MIKIAFYLDNAKVASRNLSEAHLYNPGIGGTQSICIQVATYLTQRNNNISPILFVEENASFPEGVQTVKVTSIESSISYVIENHIVFFVVDTRKLTKELLFKYRQVNFIGWANCDIDREDWDWLNGCDNLKRIICVGVCEKEIMRGHKLYDKCVVLYPPVPSNILNKIKIVPNNKRGHNVVYIGSLIRSKGFGYLAKAWSEVLQKVPDANLFVIGSGQLYNENIQLGKWGIAEQDFEEDIMKYLAPDGQNTLPSVHFLGILGKEKYQIMADAKVGVPNPSGQTETFCISAAEMQMMGCAVTTIYGEGFIDSVADKNNLYESIEMLPQYIVRLLLQTEKYDQEFTMSYLERFSPQNVSIGWEMMLNSLILH